MSEKLEKGTRVRITGVMQDEPRPLPIGSEGTVISHRNVGSPFEQILVTWESGRSLMLVPEDPFEVIAAR